MKKLMMLLAVGTVALAACNRENNTTEDTTSATTVNESATGTSSAGTADYEAEYRDRADRLATQMATDLKLDTTAQERIRTAYYNRARRIDEIRGRYHLTGTNLSGGVSAEVDTTGLYGAFRGVDLETDNELRNFLSPEQYQLYQSRRSNYWSADGIEREVDIDGDEITVKTGDIKIKAEPGKSKVETSTYESKIKGDERKYKSDDLKIKSEPGKTKIESGDSKIKIKED